MQKKDIQTEITKRFLEICDKVKERHKYPSDAKFSEKVLHLHPRSFSAIRNLSRMISTDLIYFTYQKFPKDVDIFWILTGQKGNNNETNIIEEPNLKSSANETINLYKELVASKEKIIELQEQNQDYHREIHQLQKYIEELETK